MVAEKGRENGRKEEKQENWSPNFIHSKNALLTVYTNSLYSTKTSENTKKNKNI